MFRMVIPGIVDNWLPTAMPRVSVNPIIANIIWAYDQKRLSPLIYGMDKRIVCPHDWLVTGLHHNDVGIPSLKVLALRSLCAYSLAYGGTSEYSYVSNVCFNPLTNLGEKLAKLPKNYISFLPE